MDPEEPDLPTPASGVAIVGMAGRFPGAPDLETFWRNVRDGVESISSLTNEQLLATGVDRTLLENPAYVKARGLVDGVADFDAGFFSYSARDALVMDPQQRLFLECSWQALESAGYDPRQFRGLIGVYGGSSPSAYMRHLYANLDALGDIDALTIAIGNELPFLTTRVSYKLDLKGPSCPVQTACSTSLVAVHLACQGLLNAECDLALAGGVSITVPQEAGYFYQEESILSRDGHCRSFDAAASGTVFSNGIGMVALKRLDDALAAGDTIYAVIRGSAINNDGARKASFTAPGVSGQSEVIADAMAAADVDPETIGYVEAHGTATSLGDSIELQALTRAFSRGGQTRQYCALGTVKANIGHLDAAAGIAGLIKTVFALQHKMLPPAAMFDRPNPDIHFERTPFYVNTTLREWPALPDTPRRAGVSSFGFGGTNAHVVLEEPAPSDPPDPSRAAQLLVLSAESADGLERATANLAAYLVQHDDAWLPDVAYTLQVGRRAFRHRRAVVCRNRDSAISLLESRDARFVTTTQHDLRDRSVVFLFPGQGAQRVGMAQGLYEEEPRFRAAMDECAALFLPHLGADIRDILYPHAGVSEEASTRLTHTSHTQPALFAVEYALAQLWMSWGVQPEACIGHSIGEFVAACLAEVMSLADAARLVALRGRLMEQMPAGVMLAVPLSENELRRWLKDGVWLAAINAPAQCVVSGTSAAITELEAQLASGGVDSQRLETSHAFHSGLMDGAVEPFVRAVRDVPLRAPKIPYISSVSGTWIIASEATDPHYWGRQLREPVRFSAGISELSKKSDRLFLEVGPGQVLSSLLRRHEGFTNGQASVASLGRPTGPASDLTSMLAAVGRLWSGGAKVGWSAFYGDERRSRVPLPTYPFDRQKYWVARTTASAGAVQPIARRPEGRIPDVREWLYGPTWRRASTPQPLPAAAAVSTPANWLLLMDDQGVAERLAERLESLGHDVTRVTRDTRFDQPADKRYVLDPTSRADYDRLLRALVDARREPAVVLHCWGVGADAADQRDAIAYGPAEALLFQSLLALAQSLGDADLGSSVHLSVVTSGLHEVTGDEWLSPHKGTLVGLCRVIPQEHNAISCGNIDLAAQDLTGWRDAPAALVDRLLADAARATGETAVAYRHGHRWLQAFEALHLDQPAGSGRFKRSGVYLITGGLGDIGLSLAEHLSSTLGAKLVLVGRSGLPPEDQWPALLRSRDSRDQSGQRIRRVQRIRAAGGEVLLVQADVSDRAQMRQAFEQAAARFGAINGVIHAAGLIAGDAFRPILETDAEVCERQFAPKVHGLCVLDEVMQGRPLDFCLLVSSLSALLGGLKYAAYASANAYMDVFASRRSRTSPFPWLTVNWDGWLRNEDEARLKQAGAAPTGFVMTSAEGIDALQRIMSADAGVQVVVSTGDLQARIDRWVKLGPLAGDTIEGAAAADAMPRHSRPNLQTEFVAPRNELERTIAVLWQDLLGLDRIGINDSFFELGGDSFLGIQVISRLKKQLAVKISAVTLYEGPTVAALAEVVQADRQGSAAPAFDVSRERGEKRRERKLRALESAEALRA